MKIFYEIANMGGHHLFIKFSDEIDIKVNQSIRCIYDYILTKKPYGIIDVYFAYASMLIHFDSQKISYKKMKKQIKQLIKSTPSKAEMAYQTIDILVNYDTQSGMDLAFASDYLKMSADEIIHLHTAALYHVYMIGFLPGFCYLGGMNQKIALPRLESPRLKIPKGSVGIANQQTGIYPLDSPGGWRIIGRTKCELFKVKEENPFLILPGDKVKFIKE